MKNMMMKELCGALQCLERPTVKKKIDASLEVYSHKGAGKPIFSAGIDGNWEYSLLLALKVMAIMAAAMWLVSRISHMLHKMF